MGDIQSMTMIVRKNNLVYTDSKAMVGQDFNGSFEYLYNLGPKFFIMSEQSILVSFSGQIDSEKAFGEIINLIRQIFNSYYLHRDAEKAQDLITTWTKEQEGEINIFSGIGNLYLFCPDFTILIEMKVYNRNESGFKNKEPEMFVYSNSATLIIGGSAVESDNIDYAKWRLKKEIDNEAFVDILRELIWGDPLAGGEIHSFDLNQLKTYKSFNIGDSDVC